MSAAPFMDDAHASRLHVEYLDAPLEQVLDDERVLAAIAFGDTVLPTHDPRALRVGLQPFGAAPLEVWRGRGPVMRGRDGDVAWAEDGALQFGAVEIDEPDGEDIAAAAERAYRTLLAFTARRGYPQLLRIWNYLDAITGGDGDIERYRRFCIGRAAGLGAFEPGSLPAATAIGRLDGERRLQLYWLAAKAPGTPLENPRQLSAYRYPRCYGPQPPSFARAMLPPAAADMPLLLSGTAAIVGHESRHADSVDTQLAETFINFDSLLASARARCPQLPPHFGAGSRLKVYVREAGELAHVAELLDRHLPPQLPRLLLHAQICRRELRIEIDGVHGALP